MITNETITHYFLGKASEYLGGDDLLPYLGELLKDPSPLADLGKAVRDEPFFRRKEWASVYELGLYRIFLYALVRQSKPKLFVETGVLHGITSNFTLAALRKNGQGKLISIDYPSYFETGPSNRDGYTDTLPPGKKPGWVIPEANRGAWTLLVGKSTDKLPEACAVGTLDIFLHDSEHTYETMTYEMSYAWERLRSGGTLICDNIDCNSSFRDFARRTGRKPLALPEAISTPPDHEHMRFGILSRA